jgi:mannosyltransferase
MTKPISTQNAYLQEKSADSIESDRRLNPFTLGLLGILLVAFLIRLYRLNSGLWFDEITTLVNYARLPFIEILTKFDSENQHFLYSIMAHVCLVIFGESAWSLRLPAVIFGTGSLWAVYWLGRKLTRDIEALLASALLAFSYHHVWFSQNARGYTGLLFWSLLSSGFLIRSLDLNQKRDWFGYGITAALGIYTHLTMLFMVIGQFFCAIYWLIARRKPEVVRGGLIGFLTAGIGTLLLYSPVLNILSSTITSEGQTAIAIWQNPLWTMGQFISGLEISLGSSVLVVAALAIFCWGLFSVFRHDARLLILFLIPPSIGAAAVILLGHHLWPRFFFFTFGFAALILIHGIFNISEWMGKVIKLSQVRSQWLANAACLGIILISAASVPLAYGPKQDFVTAKAFIDAHLATGDQVATVGLASFVYTEYLQTDWKPVSSLDDLSAMLSGLHRTWVIYTLPEQANKEFPEIMELVQSRFQLIASFPGTLGDGTIFVCLYEPFALTRK